MSAVSKWIVLGLLGSAIGSFTSASLAMPPVVLTRDKTTAADLTGSDLLVKQQMQDCQLRLEGPPNDYRLVYSGGSIPVPRKAVKTIQDGGWVRLAVKGKMAGLRVRMLSIPYFAQALTEADIFGLDGKPSQFGGPAAGYYIVFSGNESVVELQLRALWPAGTMLNHRNHPNPNPGTLQYVADKEITDPVGGEYGILPLQSKTATTTVDYVCKLRHQPN